jgi:hypothetical protein
LGNSKENNFSREKDRGHTLLPVVLTQLFVLVIEAEDRQRPRYIDPRKVISFEHCKQYCRCQDTVQILLHRFSKYLKVGVYGGLRILRAQLLYKGPSHLIICAYKWVQGIGLNEDI